MSNTVFYRRINLNDNDELSFIAKIDVTIPAQYDSDFLVNDETVQKQFQNLKDKFSEDDFFDVAEDVNKNIIGYHAVKRVSVFEKQAGSIYTLWVSPNHRNQGIATELKKRSENWAKENKLDHIFTWVHSDNSKMILLNKSLGYEIVNFKMKKAIPINNEAREQLIPCFDNEMIFDLERQLHSFEIRSNKDKISKLLADDFIEFGSSGKTWNREDILRRLPAENGKTRIDSYNFKANRLAENIILVTYISKRLLDDGTSSEFLRSSIWQFVNNEWKMKFHQGTTKD